VITMTESITVPLGSLRPGDVLTHQITRHAGLVELPRPLLVTHALAVIDPVSGVRGVRVYHPGPVEHVLYPDAVLGARVESRQRGHADASAAAWACLKARGWQCAGGCYFTPSGDYSGFRGGPRMTRHAVARGYIVQVGARWYRVPRWASVATAERTRS
jgi:hypothetical protein